jgi:uncharacterized membrane protein (UPF0127 family)
MQKALVLILLTIFILGCVQSPAQTPQYHQQPIGNQLPGNYVCFGEKCVNVQVMRTEAEKEKGLMGVTTLPKEDGMLFVWNAPGVYPFWMKDTLIPLDMVWINTDMQVVDITTMQPCAADPCPIYSPHAQAQYVLETNAGLMQEWNVRVGDIGKIQHT